MSNGGGCVAPEPEVSCTQDNGQNWAKSIPQLVASRNGYKNETLGAYEEMRVFPPRGFHGLVDHGGFMWVLGGAHRAVGFSFSLSPDVLCGSARLIVISCCVLDRDIACRSS